MNPRRRGRTRLVPVLALAPIALLSALAVANAGGAAAVPVGASAPAAAIRATPTPAPVPRGTAALRDVQLRLEWLGMKPGPRTGTYTPATKAALRHFQEKFGLPQVGVSGPRTTALLLQVTSHGSAVHVRCRVPGKVICIDKSQRILRAYENGKLVRFTDARFGRTGMETREGAFRVYRKSRNHISAEFGGPMPYAMFFSRGQAVHFSADFAAHGYTGASHGCVNVRSRTSIAWLFGWATVDTKVVVYH